MVEQVCGVSRERFLTIANLLLENSGRERTSAIAYAAALPPAMKDHETIADYVRVEYSANVPLWARNHRLLGPLFFSSAMGSGLAATTLATPRLMGGATASNHRRIARAERSVLWTELALTLASGVMLRGLARPLIRGRWAPRYLVGAMGAGLIAPLAIGDRFAVLRSLLVLVGALSTRFAWTEAGKESANDPQAYFSYTAASADPRRARAAGEPGHASRKDEPERQRHGARTRPNLPTRGRISGVITLVQEDRFRLEDALGRGYLFTLGRGLGIGLQQLRQSSARQAEVEVDYEGAPDLGAVAAGFRERTA